MSKNTNMVKFRSYKGVCDLSYRTLQKN